MKKKWLFILLALAAAAGISALALRPDAAEYTETTAYRGTVETYYNFEGNVTAPRQQTVAADGADTVREVYVQANAQVQKDDRLLKLENAGTIRAQRDGEVTGLFVHADDRVNAGQTLLQITDLRTLEMEMQVDEYDVAAIEIGKQALATVEATGQTIDARVSMLNKQASVIGDLSYYTATLSFDPSQAPGVLPGMRVSARVLNERAEDVTILEMDALRFDETNQPYVLMRDGKETRQVPVRVGVSDGVNVEIIAGLEAGDTVLKGGRQSRMAERMEKMRAQMEMNP